MDGGGEGADCCGEPRCGCEYIGRGAASWCCSWIIDDMATPAVGRGPRARAKLCRGEDRYDCSHVKRGLALFDGTGCGGIAGSPEPGSDRDRCRRGPDQN